MLKEILPHLDALVTGVVVLVLGWWLRFRKTDSATVFKLKAESIQIISDSALKIADRLRLDLDVSRDENDELERINAEMEKSYKQSQIDFALKNNALMDCIDQSNKILELKKKHYAEHKERILHIIDLLKLSTNGLTKERTDEFLKRLHELLSKYER